MCYSRMCKWVWKAWWSFWLCLVSSQQKWESLYPCYFYSASKQGWLAEVCGEYGIYGDEFWQSEAVKMGEHPRSLFSVHLKSDKYANALKRQQETQQLLKRIVSTNNCILVLILRPLISNNETMLLWRNFWRQTILWLVKSGLWEKIFQISFTFFKG